MTKTCSAPDCDRDVFSRELCSKHLSRFYKYGTTDLPVRKPKAVPVKLDKNGCWNYRLKLDKRGYGRVCRGSVGQKTQTKALAHRWVWERTHGPIPAGFHLHHGCSNRACCNPDHMQLMAPADHFDHHREHGWVPVRPRASAETATA